MIERYNITFRLSRPAGRRGVPGGAVAASGFVHAAVAAALMLIGRAVLPLAPVQADVVELLLAPASSPAAEAADDAPRDASAATPHSDAAEPSPSAIPATPEPAPSPPPPDVPALPDVPSAPAVPADLQAPDAAPLLPSTEAPLPAPTPPVPPPPAAQPSPVPAPEPPHLTAPPSKPTPPQRPPVRPVLPRPRPPLPVGAAASQGQARPSPAPPVASATAPAPAAPVLAAVAPAWSREVSNWFARRTSYPDEARRHGDEGRAIIRFTVARDGHVLHVDLVKGTSSSVLDRAVDDMLAQLREAHLPPFPAEMTEDEVIVTRAISYSLNR